MAGAESEAVILGFCNGGDDDDRDQILDIVSSGEAGRALAEHWAHHEMLYRRQVRRLVRKHRAAIERVATMLENRGRLSGIEIAEATNPIAEAQPSG